jgi:hypothetical protein
MLAHNCFREWLAYDFDRLIIGIVVVDVLCRIGELGDKAGGDQTL